ncbi:MAG: endoglucanase [Solirubrobacteraceae bacterium]|nr:endoglucanase [Solirubrobacteraceae bacterium]
MTRARLLSGTGVVLLTALAACGAPDRAGARTAYVRLDQVGFPLGEAARALVLSPVPDPGARFRVLDTAGRTVASGRLGRRVGAWSRRFPHVYPVQGPRLAAGTYRIAVSGPGAGTSPPFTVDAAAALYGPVASDAVSFFRAQRDGPNVDPSLLHRAPSHLADRSAGVYATPRFTVAGPTRPVRVGGPVDVSGGWFDAGDYLKFVQTASFDETMLLWTLREHPAANGASHGGLDAEARFGLDWLAKMWDPAGQGLLYQVGIGDGGRGFLGSHDVWQLPQASDALNVGPGDPRYFLKYRPAFRGGAVGSQLSPNLAGRLAAAFGLCAQVYRSTDPALADRCVARGAAALARARTAGVGRLTTTAPYAYYPEQQWRDDMELGSIEMYRATGSRRYLVAAAHWADAYMRSGVEGNYSISLYDVSAIAHYDVARALPGATAPEDLEIFLPDILGDLRDELRSAAAVARRDPFGLGVRYADDDTVAHALGLSLEAAIYGRLSGKRTFAAFGRAQRDWALGANAWGTSFVVGAGTTFPRCLHHQNANLAGSLTGAGDILRGASVQGPAAATDFRDMEVAPGYRPCPAGGGNRFAPFDGRGARYMDDVRASASNEPSGDIAALTLALAAAQMDGRP